MHMQQGCGKLDVLYKLGDHMYLDIRIGAKVLLCWQLDVNILRGNMIGKDTPD